MAFEMDAVKSAIQEFRSNGVDVYLYSGPIEKRGYDTLCEILKAKKNKSDHALLYLITRGGDPNAGYRIARALCHAYGSANLRVAITSDCKSAGTLICIGAGGLVIFDKGELGPLDVQFKKQDEMFQQSSGLDILRGMTYLRGEALDSFKDYLVEINIGSGLSTKTASEIASKLVIGLFEPMFAQIDPVRLGEMNAALQIAAEYGTRLNEKASSLQAGALSKLIHDYSTHGFVIDRSEARKLFNHVSAPTPAEIAFGEFAETLAPVGNTRMQPVVWDMLDVAEQIFQLKKKEKENDDTDREVEGSIGGESAAQADCDTYADSDSGKSDSPPGSQSEQSAVRSNTSDERAAQSAPPVNSDD